MLKQALWVLWQGTWCLPQNLIGLCLYLVHRHNEHCHFRGALVTAWNYTGCTSLGCFLFICDRDMQDRPLLVHEYGHTVQSAVLGWLYLPVIALPSMLWFALPVCRRYRREHHCSYYAFYTERWANSWGERVTGERPAGT